MGPDSALRGRFGARPERETPSTGELCQISHALSQAAGVYLKVVEVGELEVRLEALEKVQAAA